MTQGDARFVVKAYHSPDAAPGLAAEQVQRELEAGAAFASLGVSALRPVWGPADSLALRLPGGTVELQQVLVFPYRQQRTLREVLAATTDPLPILREAGRRIGERHRQARSLAAIHTDGTPANIFEDWMWFDFAAVPRVPELEVAKSAEIWRFLSATMALTPWRAARAWVGAFCEAYADLAVIRLALSRYGFPFPGLRMVLHPYQLCRLVLGRPISARLSRLRTARALACHVAHAAGRLS